MSGDALRIQLVADDADPLELEGAVRRLHDELGMLTELEVARPTARAPRKSKSGELALAGQLLVTVLGSGGVAVAMVGVIKDWLSRHQGMKLRVKRGNDEIEVSGVRSDELAKLLSRLKAWAPGDQAKGG